MRRRLQLKALLMSEALNKLVRGCHADVGLISRFSLWECTDRRDG
jgi:hypothetical protein